MKLVFIYPFINRTSNTPIKWLPLSAAILIGNLRKKFSEIIFHQFDLEEEIRDAISKKKLDGHYLDLLDQFIYMECDFATDRDLIKYNKFLTDVINYLKLGEYDHYLFSFYNRHPVGIKANILLAKYLKKRYKNKKIIFGGIYGYGNDYTKHSFEEFDFIDSFVIGRGEAALKEILINLLKNKRIKKIYQNQPKRRLWELPDFKSFKSFRYFCYSSKDLESLYGFKFGKKIKTDEKIVFIPYFFSQGCFWRKCAYCAISRTKEFYHKEIDKITKDLARLKKVYQTKYFVFFNNNFNSNLDFSKKLLRSFIKNKLNILWTDSFNLVVLDEELIDLLARAGCFRMDIGTTVLNSRIQKLYNNILQDNSYLKNLKKISQRGIWTHINLIANLPYQYSVKKDKAILDKYMEYIDGVTLNSYRRYSNSDLTINHEKYNLENINDEFLSNKERRKRTLPFIERSLILPFIERSFKGTIEEREELFEKNYIELKEFFREHKKFLNKIDTIHLYLLGHLYSSLGFTNKNKIKEIVAIISKTSNWFARLK